MSILKLIFVSILSPVLLQSQLVYDRQDFDFSEISGQVTDAETGVPLPGVNLFLDQTQKGTATDSNGNFEIKNIEPGNYTLVISMVGYKLVHLSISLPLSESQPFSISLSPTVTELSEITVKAERSRGWLRNLRRFEEAFLGITENALQTEIINPEILDFDRQRGRLIATTRHNPLVLKNYSMGYKIEFYIRKIEIRGERIDTDGFANYKELEPSEENEYENWLNQRYNSYKGSFRHFISALANNEIENEGFVVFYSNTTKDLFEREQMERYINGKRMNDKIHDISEIISPASIPGNIALLNRRSKYIGVIYRNQSVDSHLKEYIRSDMNRQVSLIELPADTALLEISTGNYFSPYRPVLHGYWGLTSKLPDLLPNDFEDSLKFKNEEDESKEILSSDAHSFVVKSNDRNKSYRAETADIRLNNGLIAKKRGQYEKALEIWLGARQELPEPSYAIGREFIQLAAEKKLKQYYEQATAMYYWGLSGELSSTTDRMVFENDLAFLELIMEPNEIKRIHQFETGKESQQLITIRLFWNRMDPVPTNPSNPRLIEHFARIQQTKARFPNPDSPLGIDGRGKTIIRYGEPDKTLDRELRIRFNDIFLFVSDFIFVHGSQDNSFDLMEKSNEDDDSINVPSSEIVSVSAPANGLIDKINSIPEIGKLDIWVYERFNDGMQDKTVFYFKEGKTNIYNQIDSIEDWIPFGLYPPVRRNLYNDITPALVIQYLYYRQLTEFDPHFRTYFNKMETEIFSRPDHSVHSIRNLSIQLRAENKQTAFRNATNAPSQHSTENRKISSIPLEIHQYRLLDEQDNPVLSTFVESRPSHALLRDLVSNQQIMNPEEAEDVAALGTIANWYYLQQGVELRGKDGEPLGRLQSRPQLHMDEQDRVPSVSLLSIPYISPEILQHVYVMLENTHPETSPLQESVFPDELRGLGRLTIPQPEPLDLSGDGPVLGDLLLGYGRLERQETDLRFPFVVSHERTIPEGENLVVHFEAYRLQTNSQGFANFEVRYEIEPKQGLFGRLLANKENLSRTLIFEPRTGHFTESLEFEKLNLEPGRYTLNWTVVDRLSGEKARQILEFEIVEPDYSLND